jgi:protein tyrosine/serine phosphatase
MRSRAELLSTWAVAALLGLPLAAPAAIGAAEGPTPAIDISRIEIDNFGQVNARYYRGEQPQDRDYRDLAALGIRTVIDLQKDYSADEARLVEGAGMRFYRIPMTTRVPPTPGQIALFLEVVDDPARQPVYVHCAGGKHRTGVMTAIYRMERDGWTPSQAFAEMKRYKFGADFLHPEFKKFVYAYQRLSLPGAPAASGR